MPVLGLNSYGKSAVRLLKVRRDTVSGRHDITELSVDIALEGNFEAAHAGGDNSLVLPTDTMKNTVYALGNDHSLDTIESFALSLAQHFVSNNPQVARARIRISQTPWTRVTGSPENTNPHPHCFTGGNSERSTCSVSMDRSTTLGESGLEGLMLLKTTNSAFSGFPRDRYTTLKETRDRVMATSLSCSWIYTAPPKNPAARDAIRSALIHTFATHKSESVQHTLHAMGCAALAACPDTTQIRLSMPNKHYLLADLSPLGLTNNNEVFIPTSEPYGLIEATLHRA